MLKQELFLSQPPPQYNLLPRRLSAQSPSQQPWSVSRMTTNISTEEPGRSDGHKQGELPLIQVSGEQEEIKGKIEPVRRISLELLLASTGLEAPGHQSLLSREIQRTTVDSCSLADGSSELGETIFHQTVAVIKPKKVHQPPHLAKTSLC